MDNPYSTITFGDLVGKLGKLRIECAKCGRSRQYRLAVQIAKYGRDEKLSAWIEKVTADCLRRHAKNANDPCEAHCPDDLPINHPGPAQDSQALD